MNEFPIGSKWYDTVSKRSYTVVCYSSDSDIVLKWQGETPVLFKASIRGMRRYCFAADIQVPRHIYNMVKKCKSM